MRSTIRRRIITAIGTAALGCAGPAATAVAQPTYYDPEVSHCGHLFRTPPPGAETRTGRRRRRPDRPNIPRRTPPCRYRAGATVIPGYYRM
ncbi:hypothetical protein GCM10011588_10580 [Nocardia jinanensis]|uniref:Uncharacterized protein n=1 Tax=Nocardia jinanensis TaxID=382504 RepID=A0A917R9Z7_9NOCA|nr:hypothetical protein GCM10011588_10580 [Nocardia jinanensis]